MEFDNACLNPATVHFPIGGMDGEAEAYDDDGDCNGCLDGGGGRRLRGLGEGVAGLVGLRPRAEAWGSAAGAWPRRKRFGACRRRCLGAGGLTKPCLGAGGL